MYEGCFSLSKGDEGGKERDLGKRWGGERKKKKGRRKREEKKGKSQFVLISFTLGKPTVRMLHVFNRN